MAEEQGLFDFLRVPRRVSKPRETGLTLVDDRCLPTSFMEEFLELNAHIIDYIKIIDHAGMFTRYKPGWMKKRLKMYDGYHIRSLPSGLSFEVAYSQGRAYEFFDKVRELGFSTVEISDDVIPGIPDKEREKLIALGPPGSDQRCCCPRTPHRCGAKESGFINVTADLSGSG